MKKSTLRSILNDLANDPKATYIGKPQGSFHFWLKLGDKPVPVSFNNERTPPSRMGEVIKEITGKEFTPKRLEALHSALEQFFHEEAQS